MYRLINRSIQCFLRDVYGADLWRRTSRLAGLDDDGVDLLVASDARMTRNLLDQAAPLLGKCQEVLLEDLGTYLVSHPNCESVRRLLRFSGETFEDFLLSLDDLPDRARLAVPDLVMPALRLLDEGDGRFVVELAGGGPGGVPGFAEVVAGALRALADDYGALVLIEAEPPEAGRQDHGPGAPSGPDPELRRITLSLLEHDFSAGRHFSLAAPEGSGAAPGGGGAVRR